MPIRAEVETRIQQQMPTLREVAGAASLPELLAGRLNAPSVYVIAEKRAAKENPYGTSAVSQRIEQTLLCVVINRNVRDARGGDAADEADDLCATLRTTLVGWQPASAIEPIDYLGGQLLAFPNQFHIWAERFRTAFYLRSV